jgi:hypothetical protein
MTSSQRRARRQNVLLKRKPTAGDKTSATDPIHLDPPVFVAPDSPASVIEGANIDDVLHSEPLVPHRAFALSIRKGIQDAGRI